MSPLLIARGALQTAVRAVSVLKRAVTGVDYPGLSWRVLRGFWRGSQCLTRCDEGHTYELGCVCGPDWRGVLSEIVAPLPIGAKRLDEQTRAAIHEALTQAVEQSYRLTTKLEIDGELFTDEQGNLIEPVDTARHLACRAAECFGMECMTECATSHRLERYAVERRRELVAEAEGVHLVHHPSCVAVPDVEGKAGPCDCGAELHLAPPSGVPLTGPQRVRLALRREGLATTGGDSAAWRLPEGVFRNAWPPPVEVGEHWMAAMAGAISHGPEPVDTADELGFRPNQRCALCGMGPSRTFEVMGRGEVAFFGGSASDERGEQVALHHDDNPRIQVSTGNWITCYEAWTVYGWRRRNYRERLGSEQVPLVPECARRGHDWSPWDCMVLTAEFPQVRYCRHCDEQQTRHGETEDIDTHEEDDDRG